MSGQSNAPETDAAAMHPVFLYFRSKELERRFSQSWRSVTSSTNTFWCIGALITYSMVTALLYAKWPDYFVETQWPRLLICMPLIAGETWLSFRRHKDGLFYDAFYLIAAIPIYGFSTLSFLLAPAEIKMFHLLEMAVIFIFCLTYYRVKVLRVLIFALLASLMSGSALVHVGLQAGMPLTHLIFQLVCLSGLAVTGITANWSREILARNNYSEILATRAAQADAENLAEDALSDARAKARFMSSVGLELQAPVREVLAAARANLDATGSADKAREYLESVHESAERLDLIIGQVLQTARAEDALDPGSRDLISVRGLVRTAMDQIWPGLGERGLSLSLEPSVRDLKLSGDQAQICEALGHVLSNAAKFSPDEEQIILDVSGQPAGHVTFTVIDRGPGIPASRIADVMEPFVQGDDGLNRQFEGLGLGLTLARRQVRANGGELRIESAPGEGTRVAMTFPAVVTDSPDAT